MRPSLVIAAAVAACTPRAVTPPAHTFVMESPVAPAVDHSDMQVDVSHVGQIFGPDVATGGGRLRRAVEPGVVLEGDAGVLHVNNSGFGGDRNAYTGRLGVLLPSDDGHAAIAFGFGGGVSRTAGTWGSADLGGVLSGKNRWVRPVLGAVIGYAAPLSAHPFQVSDGDITATLELPRNAFFHLDLGLEIGPPGRALLLGASAMHFWLFSNDRLDDQVAHLDQGYVAIGIGTRLALD